MFTGYFDESGTHGSPVCVVAGLLGSVSQLERLEEEWKSALAALRLSSFHAKDFYASNKWTDAERSSMTRSLVGAISRRTNKLVMVGVRSQDYESLIGKFEKRKRYFGSMYAFAVYNCLHVVRAWAEDYDRKHIALVFDQGHKNAGEVFRIFRKYSDREVNARFAGLSFADDKKTTALQAADFLSWWVHRLESGKVAELPLPFSKLHITGAVLNRADLEQYVDLTAERHPGLL